MVAADVASIQAMVGEIDDQHARALPERYRVPRRHDDDFLRLDAQDTERTILVCVAENGVVGFVDVRIRIVPERPYAFARRIGYVVRLVVTTSARGCGAGRLLMRAAVERVRASDCTTVELSVLEFNESARALYDSLGFETIARRLELKLTEAADSPHAALP